MHRTLATAAKTSPPARWLGQSRWCAARKARAPSCASRTSRDQVVSNKILFRRDMNHSADAPQSCYDSGPALNLKFLNEHAAITAGPLNSPHSTRELLPRDAAAAKLHGDRPYQE